MFRGIVFVGLLAMTPSLALAQQPCTTDARRVVDELYRHMLERTADSGSQAWVDRLNSGTTVRELVEAFCSVVGEVEVDEGPRRPGDVVGAYAHSGSAERLLGWTAERSLEDGVRDALAWNARRPAVLGA